MREAPNVEIRMGNQPEGMAIITNHGGYIVERFNSPVCSQSHDTSLLIFYFLVYARLTWGPVNRFIVEAFNPVLCRDNKVRYRCCLVNPTVHR